MKKILRKLLVSFLFLTLSLEARDVKNIALVKFNQLDGSPGLKYLADALPDSIAPALADNPGFNLIERRRVAEILKEIEYEQSGLLAASDRDRTRQLLNADYLFMGSYSGDPNSITVNLSLVDALSGEVVGAKTLTHPLAEIFNKTYAAAGSVLPVNKESGTGFISVFSTPSGAEIYLDGTMIGKTPLANKEVSTGNHRIILLKKGHEEEIEEFTITSGDNKNIRTSLVEKRAPLQGFIGLAVDYRVPIASEVSGSVGPQLIAGAGFKQFNFRAEVAFQSASHNYSLQNAFNASITQERSYGIFAYGLHVEYHPFLWNSVSPWLGLGAGGFQYSDSRKKITNGEESEDELGSGILWNLSASFGLEFLPGRSFSPFLEARYNYIPERIERIVNTGSSLLGGLTNTTTNTDMSAWYFSAGLRYYWGAGR